MPHQSIRREIVERYHLALPEEIRSYLKRRGIPATMIERHRLGWNGTRITIPVFGREGEILGFRYAQPPDDLDTVPDIQSDLGLDSELYGWDTLLRKPQRIVVCQREFDRLVLETNGFPAVCPTKSGTFLDAWLPYFEPIAQVFICFDRDLVGAVAARKLQRLIPSARIVTLPAEVGEHGTVTDYFVGLQLTRIDFEVVLAGAVGENDSADRPPVISAFRPTQPSVVRRVERVKRAVRLYEVAAGYTELHASAAALVGHCPFHDDHAQSFTLYPTSDTYACSVCGATGDIVRFIMDKESMTFGQALEALDRFRYTHKLPNAD